MRTKLLLTVLLVACDETVPNTLGMDEPIRVHGAQFIPGPLPTGDGGGPAVTNVTVTNNTVLPGQASKAINGRAQGTASAVGVRLADLGQGYWVVPMGPSDNQFPGELTWQAITDFNPESAKSPGHHTLEVVAVDQNDNPGAVSTYDMCLETLIPDNGAMCDPTKSPPAAVITLTWDVDSDVDLVVVGPDGNVTDPKHPATVPPDGGGIPPTTGTIDRDSLANCVPDGRRQEDLVWNVAPATGSAWDIYANLFDACGQRSVTFTATVYTFSGGAPVAQQSVSGVFTSYDANGGAALGTYLFTYTF